MNEKGGIISPFSPYTHTGFINLDPSHETDCLTRKWKGLSVDAQSSMLVINRVLSELPNTSSAILASCRGQAGVIANLITEKSPPSSQKSIKDDDAPIPPTIFRRGLSIETFDTIRDEKLDRGRLNELLEVSFGRKIDAAYWERLQSKLFYISIAGDYNGALIVTKEGPSDLVYLDKFAVSPTSQGLGVADLLWSKLTTNTNVFWRSRSDNPVNKWYFERADGHVTLGHWTLFWFGCQGLDRYEEYQHISRGIAPSFHQDLLI
jgi:amino-acid N-acetyltransferase